ncbi:MAG: hypothetical protein QM768_20245 [Agriterribacter sp.]
MSNKRALIEELEKLSEDASTTDIQKITSQFFKQKIWISQVGRGFFIGAILLAIITILLLTNAFKWGNSKILDMVAYSFWTIVPPSWFMFEYTWLFPSDARFDTNQLADLKYKHELAAKIWGGLVLLITAIIYWRYKVEP